jgi:hypothetical protein
MPPAASVLAAAPSHHGEVTKDRGSWGADLARPPDKGAWFLSQDCPLFRTVRFSALDIPAVTPVLGGKSGVAAAR